MMRTINLDLRASNDYFVNEAFRTLRANIQFCGTDVKAIAVTSCYPNEGKSTIAIELSKSLAEAGKKVLFIDADMRKSVIVRKYANEGGLCGLSRYLSGQNSLEEVLFATQIEGMHVIFAGQFPANPAELVGSNAFKKLIEEQTKVYDYVIVDTPPLGAVIDCAVVANVCDSAIMVVAAEKTEGNRAAAIKEQLAKSGVHILGVVLNRVRGKRGYSGRYSVNKKYGYDVKSHAAKAKANDARASMQKRVLSNEDIEISGE